MTTNFLTFDQAPEVSASYSNRHLLLGNGFDLYGDPDSPLNQEIRKNAENVARLRSDRFPRFRIDLFDAASAKFWG